MKNLDKYMNDLYAISQMPLVTFSDNIAYAKKLEQFLRNIYSDGFREGVNTTLPEEKKQP